MSAEPVERKRTRNGASAELVQPKCRRNSLQDTAVKSAVSSPPVTVDDVVESENPFSLHIALPERQSYRIRRRFGVARPALRRPSKTAATVAPLPSTTEAEEAPPPPPREEAKQDDGVTAGILIIPHRNRNSPAKVSNASPPSSKHTVSSKSSSSKPSAGSSNSAESSNPPLTQEERPEDGSKESVIMVPSPEPTKSSPSSVDDLLQLPSSPPSKGQPLLKHKPQPNKKLWRQSTSTAAPAETTGGSEPTSSNKSVDAAAPPAAAETTSDSHTETPNCRSKVASRHRRSLPASLSSLLVSQEPSAAPIAVHAPTATRYRQTMPSSALRRSSTLPNSQPRCVYPDELLTQMMREAKRFTPINYLEAYTKVKGGARINAESRRLILHYMLDVTHNIANPVSQFSAHMAAALFDRYLAWAITHGDSKLQEAVAAEVEVVGAACLYIASKLEDTWSLCLSDVCRTFDGGSVGREKVVLRWELKISSDFGFEFNAPTAVDFMHPMLQRTQDAFGPLPSEVKDVAFLAADEALLCAGCLGVAAHVVAAAALLIAVTEVHGKAHRTANLPMEVRELLGPDRKQLCAVTGVLFHSLGDHPAFKAFKRRKQERTAAAHAALGSPCSGGGLSLSQESSFSLPRSSPTKPRRYSEA